MERKTIVLDVQVLKRVRTTRCYSCTALYTAPSVRPVPPRADHTGTAATTTIIQPPRDEPGHVRRRAT